MGGVVTTQSSERMWSARVVYAFGEPVPEEYLGELLEDGWTEDELTTENLETLLEYDRRDAVCLT